MILSTVLLWLSLVPGSAQANELSKIIQKQKPALEKLYHDLHRQPELSGQEERSSQRVAAEFRELGLETITSVGGHGVVGILKNGKGPTTWVRSDLDALPVTEETQLTYKSQSPGKMHACGHDFHTMALIGAAHVMGQTKASWHGTIVFVAQPAEELNQGAKAMVRDPKFKSLPKPDRILALHTTGGLKKGTLGITPGFTMANVDSVDVTFKGVGTHGALPETGIDPFIQSAEFILKMQTLLGREKTATDPAVISVGTIHGGLKRNIIPPEVKIQLTVRTYSPQLRTQLKKRIGEIANGLAATAGATKPEIKIVEATDATFNDPHLTRQIKDIFIEQLGKDAVVDGKPSMAGEDFGQFGKATGAPSLYFMIGEQDEKNPMITNHSPLFAPDFARTGPFAVRAMSTALLALHQQSESTHVQAE